MFSYQSECHCAKTSAWKCRGCGLFSYQSECHCAKTWLEGKAFLCSLVTSQNVTAPKLIWRSVYRDCGLVTSQNVTAPKPRSKTSTQRSRLVTSQNVTAPKPLADRIGKNLV